MLMAWNFQSFVHTGRTHDKIIKIIDLKNQEKQDIKSMHCGAQIKTGIN